MDSISTTIGSQRTCKLTGCLALLIMMASIKWVDPGGRASTAEKSSIRPQCALIHVATRSLGIVGSADI